VTDDLQLRLNIHKKTNNYEAATKYCFLKETSEGGSKASRKMCQELEKEFTRNWITKAIFLEEKFWKHPYF
jgi:hypothetical protein